MSKVIDPVYKDLNTAVVTKKAKEEMIDVHSQKLIKAWIDKIQYGEKIQSLEADWELVPEEAKKRVEGFIDRRLADPQGAMMPENEIAHAVAVRMGIDTVTQNYKNACSELEFFERVIKLIQGIKI